MSRCSSSFFSASVSLRCRLKNSLQLALLCLRTSPLLGSRIFPKDNRTNTILNGERLNCHRRLCGAANECSGENSILANITCSRCRPELAFRTACDSALFDARYHALEFAVSRSRTSLLLEAGVPGKILKNLRTSAFRIKSFRVFSEKKG